MATNAIPTTTGKHNKYRGAVAVGTSVYFAPANEDNVGVFDTDTNTLRTVATDVGSFKYKYDGAAAVGNKIYFAPYYQDNVGVLDTVSDVFSTVAMSGDAADGLQKYSGAVAIGARVFFAPYVQDNVGILDTGTNTFTTVATTGDEASKKWKYREAAAVEPESTLPHTIKRTSECSTPSRMSSAPSTRLALCRLLMKNTLAPR